MHSNPKITIIIPVYNRAQLLPYTLNSILEQTFTEWECILIDDHSTDDSFLVLKEYQKKDLRFKAFRRPTELKKGANSCRNYGFLKASAYCIKWFDSDDVMLPLHLELAYTTLIENNLDFVVTDTLNFKNEDGEILDKPYNFDRNKSVISAKNFAMNRIGWITDDFLGTRELVEKIKFNENITTDGDEYNFFVRYLHLSIKGVFINEVLTHRRIHENSITNQNGKNTINYLSKVANIKYQTANDLVGFNNRCLIRWFLSGYMQFAFSLSKNRESVPFLKPALKLICIYLSFINGGAFIMALGSARFFKKGYNIMKYAKK